MASGVDSWMEMQRELYRLLQTVFEQCAAVLGAPAADDGLNAVWRQFGFDPGAAGDPIAAFAKLFSPAFSAAPAASGADAFSQWFNQSLQALLSELNGEPESQSAPFDFLKVLLGSPFPMWPSAVGRDDAPFQPPSWPGVTPSEAAAMQDLPPFGLTREWETAWRALRQAHREQVDAGNALGRQIGFIYHAALKRYAKAISANDTEDREITSLRELYDLWVTIAEEVYAEKVMTKEYSVAFGNFINAGARCRKARQTMVDDLQELMNLPNRREIDSIIERQHAMQAELRAVASRTGNDIGLDALKSRVEALSRRLDGLAEAPSKKSASTTVKKPKKAKAKAAPDSRAAAPAKAKRSKNRKVKIASASDSASPTKRKRPKPAQPDKPAAPAASPAEFNIDSFATDDG